MVYVKGTEMYLADTLFSAYLKDEVNDDPDILCVPHTVKELPISECRVARFKIAIESDPELNIVYDYFKKGWPDCIQKVPANVKQYFKFKNDLFIEF
ncbi:transposon Tf2-9 polyprotein [Nephila pilipes]|uniref:Transposon Tf2-9 polyprotein n=1 Tax=Nephila pilipes TaxID=299642 RepID=A0A8X6QVA4_NEPPI|nr:transposon Tf2-9 polyprotein [Nephila pilipes]